MGHNLVFQSSVHTLQLSKKIIEIEAPKKEKPTRKRRRKDDATIERTKRKKREAKVTQLGGGKLFENGTKDEQKLILC